MTHAMIKRCGCLAIVLLVISGALAAEPTTTAAPAPADAKLGINLSGPVDWNTELPFVDIFRLSRQWISQKNGGSWGGGPELAVDAHGWITKLDPDCYAETPICTISGGHYPSGDYTVLYDGEGQLNISNIAKIISNDPGKLVFHVEAPRDGFFLQIKQTNPANYVRNIRVLMPGFADAYKDNPFNPTFLNRWHGVACFRFMDWMLTNGSPTAHWADRPTMDDSTWMAKGIPVEVMIDLCNRQKADAWFNMPHLADDDYVKNFATVVRDKLDPHLKVYIEYSNELWNSQFPQTHWAGEQGEALNIGPKERPWEAGWHFTAYRSTQIFKIWEDVFGGTDRLVRVLASQAANSYVSEQIIGFQDAYKHADALAIAPYLTCIAAPGNKPLDSNDMEKWTVDQALDYLENTSLPESTKWIAEQKKMADKYGLKLVAYEGGQHMVGAFGAENNDAVTQLFEQANANPRMGRIYDKYFAAWTENGGDLFCYYSSVSFWSKWGSWGALQYADEDPTQSPKFMSLIKWAKSRGQSVTVSTGQP
jgi:hypothetical protein